MIWHLPGMTREHYSMIEIDRRLLPAAPVQRFAAWIPLYGQNFSLPETPGKIPGKHLQACKMKWIDATLALHKAEQALKTCETQLLQQQVLDHLIQLLTHNSIFPRSPRFERLLETLAYKKEMIEKKANPGQWLLFTTQKNFVKLPYRLINNYCRKTSTYYHKPGFT